MNDFETIAVFDDYITANFAKQRLEAHGILCYLADENTVTIKWILSNAMGGIKLRVPFDKKVQALNILNEEPEQLTVDHTLELGSGEAEVICPQCASNNTGTETGSKTSIGVTWLLLGAPLSLLSTNNHRCFYCGYQWQT